MGLEPAELARWTRFAAKGGIGKCTATCDCVAESPEDLMFLKDDEITVLLQLQDLEGCYLGYCEGVVGRFSGSDVVFHSKLKKPVMAKRASTSTTLSVNSITNIPYSPIPVTPTTPTGFESSANRSSSRKMVAELLTVGGGRSPSQNSLRHVSPSSSTPSSPIPGGGWHGSSNIGTRNSSQDIRRAGALQYGTTSPREFHNSITVTDDVPAEDAAEGSDSPQGVGVSVDEASTSTLSSRVSNSIVLTSSSTALSLALEPLQLSSSPNGREDISASLRPPGSLVSDHDPTSLTAPLRIIKRSPSTPTSPAISPPAPASTPGSPNALSSNDLTQNELFDSSLANVSHVFDDMARKTEPILESPPPPQNLHLSGEFDRRSQGSTLPSPLDTSVSVESAADDLTTSHPGRFSRFSIGSPFSIPQLLSMTSANPSRPIHEPQDNHHSPISPQATLPSKRDGRTSLSIAARGKVDEATLASTQAQVGIGLSLLQDLVGGMSSDSESDFGDSDEEATAEESKGQAERTSKGAENGHPIFVRTVNLARSSVTASEGGGLRYEEDEPHTSPTKNDSNRENSGSAKTNVDSPVSPASLSARSPPRTPPVRHQSPRSPTRGTLPDSFPLPDVLDRQRRPSLATSVVSGLSGKSGTSSSWDADIYDNYRYSTFSVGSSVTPGAGRRSMDSARTRTDSVSVAGRRRLDSIGPIQDVAEEAESADQTVVEDELSRFEDASFYSQGSRLSDLSRVIASIAPDDSIPSQSVNGDNRPSPILVVPVENLSPLLHTEWASPVSPPASTVQTALPPPTVDLSTPHVRQSDAAVVPRMVHSVLSQVEIISGEHETTGIAPTMGRPIPDEALHSPEKSNDSRISITSAGLGQAIVIDDDEELPSRILVNGDDEQYDNEDSILESRDGNVTANSSELKELETNVIQDESRPPESPSPRTSFGRLASLFVSNRTPSPAMFSKADENDSQVDFNSSQSNSRPPSFRVKSPLSQQSQPSLPPTQPQAASEPVASTLRPRTSNVGQERRSLFLPHPNAPKAPANASLNLEPGAGVGLISSAYPTPPLHSPSEGRPPVPSLRMYPPVQVVIRMALSMPPKTALLGPGKAPVQILPTIYGRTELDLPSSDRPVPIIFGVDPPPVNAGGGGKATAPRGALLPAIGAGGSNSNGTVMTGPTNFHGSPPRRPSTAQALPGRGLLVGGSNFNGATVVGPTNFSPPRRPSTAQSFTGPVTSGVVPKVASLSVSQSASEDKDKTASDNTVAQKTETTFNAANLKVSPLKGASPIPRPNFTPKGPGVRPRSRSFSGFNSSDSRAIPPLTNGKKHESISNWTKRTASASALATSGLKRFVTPSRPSPLSVSAVTAADESSKPSLSLAPTSPLARNVFVPPRSASPSPSATISATSSPVTAFLNRTPLNVKAPSSTLAEAPQPHTTDAPIPAGSGVARQPSLRSKLSLPNLRKNRIPDEDTVGVYDRDSIERRSDRQKEVMQVKDMQFELVRPNFSSLQAQRRASEDSMIGRPDNASDSGGLLRSESPAVSLRSSDYRSVEMGSSVNGHKPNLDPGMTSFGQSNDSMEAHRQREAKWVSLMASSPASLSRKSKKVKKLLLDGVPSSVRYLIWSYLTDGKGRAVKGVYERLCQRGEVVRTQDIVADAERLFGGDAENDAVQYLHANKSAIIVLLQAYFSMVPDVQYTPGLTKIVGQLLLLAPEEDAFWIFTSIMDTHIRPYFTITIPAFSSGSTQIPRSTQMEVDAALYSRALETIDPPVAKKIFVELGILPGALCHPWFSSLFVGTLPRECVNRVWDIFLYEGIPFLLRVALSLTIVCRKFILSPTTITESTVLATLARPPSQWLPPTPESFLALAFSVKLKDDDIRKQRIKMGGLVKRQTQAQQALTSVIASAISFPSLSRV